MIWKTLTFTVPNGNRKEKKVEADTRHIRKCPGHRYKILSGPGGHYVYDYKSLDVMRKDGKFFIDKEGKEINDFFRTLREDAPVTIPRKFQ